ncbi:hypothetical protein QBC40DRAFT_252910 [Triangularia verruculosa]|uniref:Uncharacterized protein n=1 Tax=Triangularia verruculosa TaxID=2587418 RepID=A0AAN7AWM6_9PEZI|nr:hypothetical protein QBC40DRAFT_252910 [Triangularia verruculosa]
MHPFQVELRTSCLCCSTAIPTQNFTISPPDFTSPLFSPQEFTIDPLFPPQSLAADPLYFDTLTMGEQPATPIQSQSSATRSFTLPTPQQVAMAAQYGLTPEQEAILREPVTPPSVMQALDLARESEEGATEPTIVKIITDAYNKVWNKIVTRPDLYLMTESEFTLFNYFQQCWPDKEIARRAVARFWDNGWAWAPARTGGQW